MVKIINLKKIFAVMSISLVSLMAMPLNSFVEAATDTKSPVLTLTVNSFVVKDGGSVTTKAVYSDNVGVNTIFLNANDITLPAGFSATKSVSGNYARTVTLSNIRANPGTYSIRINNGTAMDAAGNVANSASFTIKVKSSDEIAPVLSLSNTNFSVKKGGSLNLNANYSDNVGINAIVLNANDITLPAGFSATKSVSGSGNATRNITLSNINANPGTYSVRVNWGTAMDAAGNSANSASFNVTVGANDTIAPKLTLSAPSSYNIKEGGTVSFIATYTDDISVKTIFLNAKDIVLSKGLIANVSISGTGNRTRTITLSNVRGLESGNNIRVNWGTAMDAAGNSANGETSQLFNVIKEKPVDPEKPEPKPVDPEKPEPKPVVPDTKPNDWIQNPNTGR